MSQALIPTRPPKKLSVWQRWFLPALRKLFNPKIVRMQYDLFEWHCEQFFPFKEHLTEQEYHYLTTCFDLAELDPKPHINADYDEYSYFSYSHRIVGETTNSSRLAFGSLVYPNETLDAARPILQQRKLEIDDYFLSHQNSLFYGLGWDILAGQFKVYFRILDLRQLPQTSLQELYQSASSMLTPRQEGLISFTYVENKLYEEKVYLYPEPEASPYEDIFPGTKGRVVMATSRRGAITQFDVSSTKTWKERINQQGQTIIDAYKKKGHGLDTIAMTDQDHFTLYFPGSFMPFAGILQDRLEGLS